MNTDNRHIRADKERIYRDVAFLADIYPPRNYKNLASLDEAASYIENEFTEAGMATESQYFEAEGNSYRNIIARYNANSSKRLIVGAHYDVAGDSPGADDNASAVAGMLEIARMMRTGCPSPDYGIDFVAFCLEEPPFFGGPQMGSAVHAKSLREKRTEIIGMICLEMIGYYSDKQGSQNLPPVAGITNAFPDTGNFIIVAGRSHQAKFAVKVGESIGNSCSIKIFTVTDPRLDSFLGLSDHSSYWKYGYNAVMITDTAALRNPYYHTEDDTAEKLNYDSIAELVKGCYNAVTRFQTEKKE